MFNKFKKSHAVIIPVSTPKPKVKWFKCSHCSQIFNSPATIVTYTTNPPTEHFACPFCLAKLSDINEDKA